MNVDGNGQTRLTDSPRFDGEPAWSPDGKKIAFRSDRGGARFGQAEVYIMNADGSGQTNLTNTPGAADTDPAWSPDGKKIAFVRDDEVYSMNANGSGQIQLTESSGADAEPSWGAAPNTAPVAASDTYTASATLSVPAPGVLFNDTDADGDTLSAAVSRNPAHGSLSLASDGSFTYTPTPGYTGPDTFTYTASDGRAASNTATVTITVTLPPDTTPPTIALNTPADGATYKLKQAVNASFACSDAASGVASCSGTVPNGSSIDTTSVGSKTFTVTATDKVGNQNTKTVSYKVIYDFKGFFLPVRNVPALNKVKAGFAVPLSFTLGGDGRNVVSKAVSLPINCSTLMPLGADGDAAQQAQRSAQSASEWNLDAGSNEVSARSFSHLYVYLWGTRREWKRTCRQFVLTLNDGTDHKADFRFD